MRRGMVAGVVVALILSATLAAQADQFLPTFVVAVIVSLCCVAVVVGVAHLVTRGRT